MPDFEIPHDLLELQRAYNAVDARCQQLSDALPKASAIIAGEPVDFSELDQARAERLDIVEALDAHSWWKSLDRTEHGRAKAALRIAARGDA